MSDSEAHLPEPPKRKRSTWRILGCLFAVGVLLVNIAVLVLGAAAYEAYHYITEPGVAGPSVELTIPEGHTGRQVAALLAETGLVEHELFFRAAIRMETSPSAIQHGAYYMPTGLSPRQVLHLLYRGPEHSTDYAAFRTTIPEGLSLRQTAALFDDPEAFLDAARDETLRDELNVTRSDLEGYLMPNTYFFDEEPSEAQVLRRMLDQFKEARAQLVEEFPETVEADWNYILTIASLVEEEARTDDERPIVASVIFNRLERKMTLDMDSTLQYALDKYGQRLLNEDKAVDSPYNTYKNAGLPPGPISNPGLASIRATLDPAETDYIFFVSNADGKTHTFSRTLREHNNAVAEYRRAIRRQRRQ